MKTLFPSVARTAPVAIAVAVLMLMFDENTVQAQSSDSVPDAILVFKEGELLRNTLIAHDDVLDDHEQQIQSMKLAMEELRAQLEQGDDKLNGRLQSAENGIKANREDIHALRKSIAALDDELKKRLQTREVAKSKSGSTTKKAVTTVVNLKPHVEDVPGPPSTLPEPNPVLPDADSSLLTTFNFSNESPPAELRVIDGQFYVLIPSHGTVFTQQFVQVVTARPCKHCKDVVRLRHASLANPVTLTWQSCKKEYLLVTQ